MEVRAGYKQTEVGIIPEDWKVKTFGKVFQFLSTANNPHSDLSENGTVRYIHYGNVHTVTRPFLDCEKDKLPYIDPGKVRNIPYLEDGDLVIVDASEDYAGLAKSVEVKNATGRHVIAGLHTLLLRSDKSQVSDGFKGYLQFITKVKQGFVRIATGISVYGVSKNNVKQILLPLPNVEEQAAIATALSDADDLITNLEKLITKKRNIKQGAMQQLLTGKKRLPGFTGEWKVRCFDELASIRKQKYDTNKSGVHHFCVELEHIEQGTGRLVGYHETTPKSSIKTVFRKGDVLFGRLMAYLRKYWLASRDGVTSSEVWPIIANSDLATPEYVFQIVQTNGFIQSATEAYGTHMPRTDWNVMKKLEMPVPPVLEQAAVAQVLSDMDAEIEELEHKLAKYKLIKQGMLQELLTGKRRLI